MSATTYGEGKALDVLLTGGFVSLHTGVPTPGNEVANGGYVRRPLGAYTKTSTGPMAATNDTILEWPVATEPYALGANISHFAIWDAVSAGNMVIEGPVGQPKSVLEGDVARFPVGTLIIRCN